MPAAYEMRYCRIDSVDETVNESAMHKFIWMENERQSVEISDVMRFLFTSIKIPSFSAHAKNVIRETVEQHSSRMGECYD